VVDYTSSSNNAHGIRAAAHIYYNYKEQNSQSTPAVLGNIIYQLLNQLTELWPFVVELYQRHANGATKPMLKELLKIFSLVEQPENVLLAD
jgi:hypothetical protein